MNTDHLTDQYVTNYGEPVTVDGQPYYVQYPENDVSGVLAAINPADILDEDDIRAIKDELAKNGAGLDSLDLLTPEQIAELQEKNPTLYAYEKGDIEKIDGIEVGTQTTRGYITEELSAIFEGIEVFYTRRTVIIEREGMAALVFDFSDQLPHPHLPEVTQAAQNMMKAVKESAQNGDLKSHEGRGLCDAIHEMFNTEQAKAAEKSEEGLKLQRTISKHMEQRKRPDILRQIGLRGNNNQGRGAA